MKNKTKRPCQRRRVIVYRFVPHGYEIRTDPVFMEQFIEFSSEMQKIANKKGFDKKEFAKAFSIFNKKLGVYPLPQEMTTRYMKKFLATDSVTS